MSTISNYGQTCLEHRGFIERDNEILKNKWTIGSQYSKGLVDLDEAAFIDQAEKYSETLANKIKDKIYQNQGIDSSDYILNRAINTIEEKLTKYKTKKEKKKQEQKALKQGSTVEELVEPRETLE